MSHPSGTQLPAILDAIRARLDTIDGLRAHAEMPDVVNPPAAWPVLTEIAYHQTFDDTLRLGIDVMLAVAPAATGLARAQLLVWPYLSASGARSVPSAIEQGGNLDGACASIRAVGTGGGGGNALAVVKFGDIDTVTTTLRFEVLTDA